MSVCTECYSELNRMTPLLNPRQCLEMHKQYICFTCGRCICFGKDPKRGLMRWQFPFKSLEHAKYYLRAAEIATQTCCGIYELISDSGRISYKIFKAPEELQEYLKQHKEKRCPKMQPLFRNKQLVLNKAAQIRRLTDDEVEQYLTEQKVQK